MEETLSQQKDLVWESIDRLYNWIACYGWAGYDPYDLKQNPLLSYSQPVLIRKLAQLAIMIAEAFFPKFSRQILRIKKEINAKAMGLFATGYHILYETTNEEKFLKKAEEILEWLERNPSKGYAGLCWGHPFNWQSLVFIPKGTPSSVITAIVGDAFWRSYNKTGCDKYLSICQSICEFFLNDLNIDELDDNKICFSKTPIDHFHIHNTNLFVADFLLKVGDKIGREDYIKKAWKALNYTLSEQNKDGSICYWGKDQEEKCKIDHYHSGFEIRLLYSIWKSTSSHRVYSALKKYFKFYCERLFTSDKVPKMTPHGFYSINIHSCAEAILCHSTLAPDFPVAWNYIQKLVPWVLQNMQHSNGWFIYMIVNINNWVLWKVNFPHIRWGQAWMLRALVQYYSLLLENRIISTSSKKREIHEDFTNWSSTP
jgi:rhamnogalacturonyl hydrolase YesR